MPVCFAIRAFSAAATPRGSAHWDLGRLQLGRLLGLRRLDLGCGLRREEATKFQPRYADRRDHLRIKGSWTKGGRERVIPITTPEQRATLDKAHKLVGEGSLIPAEKTSYCPKTRTA